MSDDQADWSRDEHGKMIEELECEEAVSFNALFAENVSLRESPAELLALYDDFKEGEDQCFEDAYHSFYKGQYDKWEKARSLLANT